MAVYYATKAYVLSFTEALAEELAGTGVTVTAVLPVMLGLLLAWSGARVRNTSSDFTPDNPRRRDAALQDAQGDPLKQKGRQGTSGARR